ncbi:acyltransferase [soil metagenome]
MSAFTTPLMRTGPFAPLSRRDTSVSCIPEPVANPPPVPARIDQFDAVRAVAFLAVFAFHTIHLPLGYLGVDLFFVLSGFLITRNLLKLRDTATTGSSFGSFFYRRLLRIVPPYYLVLLLVFVFEHFSAHELGWYLGFASNIRDSIKPTLGGPQVTFWSIAVEEQFYIVWPFLVLLLPKRALVPVFFTAIVAATAFRCVMSGNDDAVYRLTLSRMDTLAAGALLAVMEVKLAKNLQWFLILGACAAAVFALLYRELPTFRGFHGDLLYDVVGYALATSFFVSVLVAVYCAPMRWMLNPGLRHVGKVSYVAYLVHDLIYDRVHALHWRGSVAIVVSLALTLVVATASLYLLEQPLQRLRGRVHPEPILR